jgi:hypothetical protein
MASQVPYEIFRRNGSFDSRFPSKVVYTFV